MKFLKKYNESVRYRKDIDKFIEKIEDELIDLKDDYIIYYPWDEYSNLSSYLKNLYQNVIKLITWYQ